MTPIQVAEVLALLQAAYPSARISRGTLEVYATFLADLGHAAGLAAARKHVASCKFFPTVAELREIALTASASCPPVEDAWAEVRRKIGSEGRYRTPTWSHPAIAACVEAIGWTELCNSEEQAIDRAHFLRLYRDRREGALVAENIGQLEAHHAGRIGKALPIGQVLRLPGSAEPGAPPRKTP